MIVASGPATDEAVRQTARLARRVTMERHMYPEQNRVFTQEEVAERLRSSVRKLQRQRRDGGGPPFFRHAGRPLYRESSFERWLAEQEVSSTSAETVAKAKRRTAPADVHRPEAV